MFRGIFRLSREDHPVIRVVYIDEVRASDLRLEFPELSRHRFMVPAKTVLPEATKLIRKDRETCVAPRESSWFRSLTLLDRLVSKTETSAAQRGDSPNAHAVLIQRGLETLVRGDFETRAPEDVLAGQIVAARCGLWSQHEAISRWISRARAERTRDGEFFDQCMKEHVESVRSVAANSS